MMRQKSFSNVNLYESLFLSFLLGVVLAASFEKPSLLILFAVSFSGFMIVLEKKSGGRAFLNGYFYGLGFFITATWWLGFLKGYFFLPLLLSVYEALFFALPAVLSKRFFETKHSLRFYIYTFSFIFFEFLRGYGQFGFPWMSSGFYLSETILKNALYVFGIYGAGWILLLFTASLTSLLFTERKLANLLFSIILILALILPAYAKQPEKQSNLKAVLLQSAVLPEEKHDPDPEKRLKIMLDVFNRMVKEIPDDLELAVFPETSFPFPYPFKTAYSSKFKSLSNRINGILVIGAETYEEGKYYNSLHIFEKGSYKGRYDKRNLVPFGEYVPFRNKLRFLPIVRNSTDFSRGKRTGVVQTEAGKFGCGICWESAIPDFGREVALKGAQILIFSTNDNWFGYSNQSEVHWRHTKAQSDATGLNVLQAANAGVTGFYDGKTEKKLPTWTTGALFCEVDIKNPVRPFYVFQEIFELVFLIISALSGFFTPFISVKKFNKNS